jgi:hypothetical protein
MHFELDLLITVFDSDLGSHRDAFVEEYTDPGVGNVLDRPDWKPFIRGAKKYLPLRLGMNGKSPLLALFCLGHLWPRREMEIRRVAGWAAASSARCATKCHPFAHGPILITYVCPNTLRREFAAGALNFGSGDSGHADAGIAVLPGCLLLPQKPPDAKRSESCEFGASGQGDRPDDFNTANESVSWRSNERQEVF